MTYLLFAVALSLSALAAYYAVMGLIAIFAAAVVPIALMGSTLEVSKLVIASWLYRGWKDIPRLMKLYFTIALVVLMMLTSMGIFGFLSKAHLDQAIPTGDISAKLALYDEKIKSEKENINASRKELSQLDSQVDQTIGRTTDATGAERAIAIRRGQQKDRARILKEIGESQTKIAKLNEERAPIASEVRKVEAEVGPIKYIAALIYGDNVDENMLERAVRIVTIMIVIVFDPLAVLLLIAANWNMRHHKEEHWTEFFKKEKSEDFPEKKEIIVEETKITEEPQEIKEIVIHDDITIDEQPTLTEEELPEIVVEETTSKDWEPEIYRRAETKEIGRYEAELLAKSTPAKTQSFLNKVSQSASTPIETDIESLQGTPNPK